MKDTMEGKFLPISSVTSGRSQEVRPDVAAFPEVHGPPRYLTPDWQAAWESVKRLAALKPEVAVTGHGRPMSGNVLLRGLEELAQNFDHVAIPDYGRFV